jgi:type I restriction enzyme S subunit
MPNLNSTILGNLPLALPPLPEQHAIATILSSLDDKIDLLHRQNATLEAMAEAVFRQWFVVPINKIEVEGGLIDGFSKCTFEKWINGTVGGEWGKETLEDEFTSAVNCIRGTDLANLNTGLPYRTPLRFVKPKKFESIEPKEGDIILEISGGTETQSTGRVCYINDDVKRLFDYPLVFSNFCRLLRVKKPEYSYFVYCYLQYLYNQDEFFNLENGSSGIKNLDYKALLFELEYPMPDDTLAVAFHGRVVPFFKKINQNKSQIRTLTTLRDTLLPKLMSGEVRVKM